MKKTIAKKKLVLDPSTIRLLSNDKLIGVNGAMPAGSWWYGCTRTCVSNCWCDTDDC